MELNIIKRFCRNVATLKAAWKEKHRKDRSRLIEGEFSLREINGKVYLIHLNVGIMLFPDTASTSEMVERLKECRAVAIQSDIEQD